MKRQLFILFTSLICASCVQWKSMIVSNGGQQQAIENAITDFVHSCSLFKQDSIFSVTMEDWGDVIVVGISGVIDENKLYTHSHIYVGAEADSIGFFPSQFLVVNEKLFYWHDPKQKITQELFDVLYKYDRISTINWPTWTIDDAKKGADYYFCKNNLRKYKRVVTRTARGWYDSPKLNCKK